MLPLEGGWNSDFDVEGLSWSEGHSPLAETRSVSPDYFRTMGIPLASGRMLTDADSAGARNVVVVDEELVREVFGNDDALGRRTLSLVLGFVAGVSCILPARRAARVSPLVALRME